MIGWLVIAGLALALALVSAYLLGEWRGSKHYYVPQSTTPTVEGAPTDHEPTLEQIEDTTEAELVGTLTDSITVVSVMDTTEVGELADKAHELETELFLRDLEEETLSREEVQREMREAELDDMIRADARFGDDS